MFRQGDLVRVRGRRRRYTVRRHVAAGRFYLLTDGGTYHVAELIRILTL
jgi:hypothetical protein